MATTLEKVDRHVIPRWRDFATTVELGELDNSATQRQPNELVPDVASLEEDWTREGTLSFAADLLSAVSLSGGSEIAKEAARFVLLAQQLGAPEHPLTKLAQSIAFPMVARPIVSALHSHSPDESRLLIHSRRALLKNTPRDAISWVDLALLYAMQGFTNKAKHCMSVALSLAPQNRFVLRSAARMFIHLDEPDRAHHLLRRSSTAKFDPWIMAAELATASAANFLPFTIDSAITLINKGDFKPSETTELSAAIATLEAKEGSLRKAKKYVREGMREPNENSLAQVKWIIRDMQDFMPDLSARKLHLERSYEALAWEAHSQSEWPTAAANSIGWLRDQPFSSRPAQVASHLASAMLEDFDAGERLARFGINANPNDHFLHIGLAFALASNNKTKEARTALAKIRGPMVNMTEVSILGNKGLIEFRDNRADAGRVFYAKAVKRATELREESLVANALTYWAREEIRIRSPLAEKVLDAANDAVKVLASGSLEAPFIINRLTATFSKMKSQGVDGNTITIGPEASVGLSISTAT